MDQCFLERRKKNKIRLKLYRTELIRRVNRYRIAGKECITLKYSNDTRYDSESNIVTHDQ